MPVVNIKVIEGVFSQDQKQEMIKRMTDVLVDLEGEYMRPFTVVVIEEVKSGDWGVGGKALSRADVKALAGGK
jgi:4-oxalocrotonate tautomerase